MDPQDTTRAEDQPSTHQLVNGRNFKVGDDYAEDLDEMRPVRRPAGSADARYNWDFNKKFLIK